MAVIPLARQTHPGFYAVITCVLPADGNSALEQGEKGDGKRKMVEKCCVDAISIIVARTRSRASASLASYNINYYVNNYMKKKQWHITGLL